MGEENLLKQNKRKQKSTQSNIQRKELLEGRIFDTTSAEVAKQNNMFDSKRNYGR